MNANQEDLSADPTPNASISQVLTGAFVRPVSRWSVASVSIYTNAPMSILAPRPAERIVSMWAAAFSADAKMVTKFLPLFRLNPSVSAKDARRYQNARQISSETRTADQKTSPKADFPASIGSPPLVKSAS